MKASEIIYNGYIAEHEDLDTAETKEAAESFMRTLESLLPEEDQDKAYVDGLYLAELSQKQGFMAGFQFALEMLGVSRAAGKREADKVA